MKIESPGWDRFFERWKEAKEREMMNYQSAAKQMLDETQKSPECDICKKKGNGEWWYGSVTSPSGASESAMVCEECRGRLKEEGCTFFGVGFGWPELLKAGWGRRWKGQNDAGDSSATDRAFSSRATNV